MWAASYMRHRMHLDDGQVIPCAFKFLPSEGLTETGGLSRFIANVRLPKKYRNLSPVRELAGVYRKNGETLVRKGKIVEIRPLTNYVLLVVEGFLPVPEFFRILYGGDNVLMAGDSILYPA